MEPRFRLPLLDRLMWPSELSDGMGELRSGTFDQIKDSVIRDLNCLLNCRQPKQNDFGKYPATRASVLRYGLPDFITYSLNTDQAQNDLALAIAQVIRDFEPRLTNISIAPMLDGGRLIFRVKADLQIEPAKERVQFQAELEADSGRLIMGEI